MPDLDDWAALGDAIERDLCESNDAVFLRGAVHRLRERLATLTTERDRLRADLTEAEAVIIRASEALTPEHPVFWILDDYDGSMDSVQALVAERDTAQALLDEEQRDHAATREELAECHLVIDRVHAAEKAFLSRAVDAEHALARLAGPARALRDAWHEAEEDDTWEDEPFASRAHEFLAAVDALGTPTPSEDNDA